MICKNESQKKLTTTDRRLGARALAHRDFAEYPQRVSRNSFLTPLYVWSALARHDRNPFMETRQAKASVIIFFFVHTRLESVSKSM